MIRLFLPPQKLISGKITVTGDDARHLSLVLRLKPEDVIAVLDGTGHRHTCKIISIHKKEVVIERIGSEPCRTEPVISVTLAQCLPRGNKMDLIIQKTTELGVTRIIPLISERSQVRSTGKISRWRKIAHSASEQSGRGKIPEVANPAMIAGFLESLTHSPPLLKDQENPITTRGRIILSEYEEERNLRAILRGLDDTSDILLLVGPEGGFSDDELSGAIRKGFVSASLGPRILRTETAPIAALSIIQYELGDMG